MTDTTTTTEIDPNYELRRELVTRPRGPLAGLAVAGLCAGYGGLEIAVENLGGETSWLVEYEPHARRVLSHRWPEVPCYGDLKTLDWDKLSPVDVVVAGFPCFVAGTVVLTDRGDLPIEEVVVGDFVWTHERRWKPVTSVMHRESETVKLQIQGAPHITTTAEHPFWTRTRYRYGKLNKRYFTEPEWVDAGDLERCHMTCLADAPPSSPEPLPPVCLPMNREMAYLMGRFLGDGWIVDYKRKGRANSSMRKVIICCATEEASEVAERIAAAGFHATRADDPSHPTCVKFHITSADLVAAFKDFGRLAHNKKLPMWVWGLDAEHKKALLEGWIDADGHDVERGWAAVTTSRLLAVGMARLARECIGHVNMTCVNPPKTKVIEGRTVNQRPWFRLTYQEPKRTPVAFHDEHGTWTQAHTAVPTGRTEMVFNISVQDDESYVADGVVVHNCQPVSLAGRRRGQDDERWIWPWIARGIERLAPRWVLLENVRGIITANGGAALGEVMGTLADLGFDAEWACFRASDVGACHRRERWFCIASHPYRVVSERT